MLFSSEDEINRLCTEIPRDSDGISSYIRHVTIEDISPWDEPASFSRMLDTFSSLTTLLVYETEVPDELPGHISRGEFGKAITTLYLCFSQCTVATLISMIFSLPNLKELCVDYCEVTLEVPLLAHSVTPQRGPLNSLELHGYMEGVGEALARFRLISSRLSLHLYIPDIEQLLMISSETAVELKLHGM